MFDSRARAWLTAFETPAAAAEAVAAAQSAIADAEHPLGALLRDWEGLIDVDQLEHEDRFVAVALRWADHRPEFGAGPAAAVRVVEDVLEAAGGTPYDPTGGALELGRAFARGLGEAARAWVVADPLRGIEALMDDPAQPGAWSARLEVEEELELEGTFAVASARERRRFAGVIRRGILRLQPPRAGLLGRERPPVWRAGDVVVLAPAGVEVPLQPERPAILDLPRPAGDRRFDRGAGDRAIARNRARYAEDYRQAERIAALDLDREEHFRREGVALGLGERTIEGELVYEIRAAQAKGALAALRFVPVAFEAPERLPDEASAELAARGFEAIRAGARTVVPFVGREARVDLDLNGFPVGAASSVDGALVDLAPTGVHLRDAAGPGPRRKGRPLDERDLPVGGPATCAVGGASGPVTTRGAWRAELRSWGVKVLALELETAALEEAGGELQAALRAAGFLDDPTSPEVDLRGRTGVEASCELAWDGRELTGWCPTAVALRRSRRSRLDPGVRVRSRSYGGVHDAPFLVRHELVDPPWGDGEPEALAREIDGATDPRVASEAIAVAAERGLRELGPRIVACLEDPDEDPGVRAAASWAAVRLELPEAAEALATRARGAADGESCAAALAGLLALDPERGRALVEELAAGDGPAAEGARRTKQSAPWGRLDERRPAREVFRRAQVRGRAALAFAPGGSALAVGAYAKVVFCDPTTGEPTRTRPTPGAAGNERLVYSPDGSLLASDSALWSVDPWAARFELPQAPLPADRLVPPARSVAFSPDGELLVFSFAPPDGGLRVCAVRDGATAYELPGDQATFGASRDALVVATGPDVRVVDLPTGEEREAFTASGPVLGLDSAPETGRLAVRLAGGVVELRDPGAAELAGTVRAPSGRLILATAFSPDGTLLATGDMDHDVKLHDASTGEHRVTFSQHEERVFGLAFSPDGRILASASIDGEVRLWDVDAALGP